MLSSTTWYDNSAIILCFHHPKYCSCSHTHTQAEVEKAAAKALSAGNKADAIDILAAFSAKHADDYHSAYDELMTHLVGLYII
jgi:hypothetical protein